MLKLGVIYMGGFLGLLGLAYLLVPLLVPMCRRTGEERTADVLGVWVWVVSYVQMQDFLSDAVADGWMGEGRSGRMGKGKKGRADEKYDV